MAHSTLVAACGVKVPKLRLTYMQKRSIKPGCGRYCSVASDHRMLDRFWAEHVCRQARGSTCIIHRCEQVGKRQHVYTQV